MKICVLYSPAGNGHRMAATALADVLARRPGVQVAVHDVLRFAPAAFRYDKLWSLVQRRGTQIYDRVFDAFDRPHPTLRAMREALNLRLLAPLADELASSQPDRVVCTHYLPGVCAAALRQAGVLRGEVSTIITDYIAHEAWFSPGMDRYYCSSREVELALERRGVTGATTTGIPLRAEMDAPRTPAPGMGRVLFLASGVPWRLVRAALASIPRDVELDIVAGWDGALRARLVAENRGPVRGFTPDLRALIDGSDVVVTKAGGLIVSECLARGRAMVLPWPAPGQERGNRAHAISVGAAIGLDDAADTGAALRKLTSLNTFAMGQAAARAATRHAATRIADDLLAGSTRRVTRRLVAL